MEDDEKAEVAEYKRKLRADVSFWNVMIYVYLFLGFLWAIYDLLYRGPSAWVSLDLRYILVSIIACVYGVFRFLYKLLMGDGDSED